MSLTDQDLQKIKAVVDARADLQDMKLEQIRQQVDNLEKNMATKEQLEQVKEMLEVDHSGLVKDVEDLKARVARLESQTV
ncbi:hypothetical protein KC644_00265 [Candidatus Berkelbacteria bacterium]|nr:hypothetical protein [Candidatus Berkelbacteria bacterium]